MERATAFLNALNQQNAELAAQCVCPEQKDDIIDEQDRRTWEFQNVSCRAASDDVECTYSIAQKDENNRTIMNAYKITFDIKDDKICGHSSDLEHP